MWYVFVLSSLSFRSAIPVPNSNPIPNPIHITLAMAALSYVGPSPSRLGHNQVN